MEKELVIQRMKDTINMLINIPAESFNFDEWVSEWDYNKHDCGTVCCVAGWYPKYFPESGLYWVKFFDYGIEKINLISHNVESNSDQLKIWHGIDEDLLYALFFPGNNLQVLQPFEIKRLTSTSTKEDVIKVWERAVYLLENEEHFADKHILSEHEIQTIKNQ